MTAELNEKRRAIRWLLDEKEAADAMAAYYAFYHPDNRTKLSVYPPDSARPNGYIASSRTGLDLFRPLLTMRLPLANPEAAANVVSSALTAGTPVLIHAPSEYRQLLGAFFQIQTEQRLLLFRLDRRRFEQEVNVLVTRSTTPDGLVRFIVRPTGPGHEGEIGASASINWQSPYFTDINVTTNPQYRRRGWGRSVVSALVQHILQSGRTALYHVAQKNDASIALAQSVGFVNTGHDKILLEATVQPPRR